MPNVDSSIVYHVQSTAAQLRNGFPYFAHHDSVSALWAETGRPPGSGGIYPCPDGDGADFDPIFAQLVQESGDDPAVLYRPDDYARPFFPVAARLEAEGDAALLAGRTDEARNRFLRAAAVYRLARFPIPRSTDSDRAWQLGKAVYERAAPLLDPPSVAIEIPFPHADVAAGDLDAPIPAYLRVPTGEPPENGWPVLLFICGLDAYRTDHTRRTQQHVDRGFAVVSIEIPGTGDCPAAPGDPASPDRLMTSVLDWIVDSREDRGFDPTRVVARGISTGGYYAFRLAHTHADRLFAVVGQGGGAHHMFDPEWVGAQNRMEYSFALADALAYKFGYRDPDPSTAVARYAADGHRFSLVESGVLDRPTCPLLAVNGMEDSIFPIEDTLLVAERGRGTDLLVRGGRAHMGNPGAEQLLLGWIDDRLAGRP